MKLVAMPDTRGPSYLAQYLVVRVDELLVVLDQAEEFLGIVDGTHRLLEDELVVLDGPADLLVYEQGLQSLGPVGQATGLVVPQTSFSGRKTALHGGLMTGRIVVIAAYVTDDPGIRIKYSIASTDYGIAGGRTTDHFALQVLPDHLLQGLPAGNGQVTPADVLPSNLLTHRLEAEDLSAPDSAFQGLRVLAICSGIPEELPLHPLEAFLEGR